MADEGRRSERPKDLDAYREWLKRDHSVDVSGRLETRYVAVVARLREEFLRTAFWQEVLQSLTRLDEEYRLQADAYPLFYPEPRAPDVLTKPFRSFFEKTFRRNVLDNEAWPAAPAAGWVLPDGWYEGLNDLVRTSFAVKYLDGVEFVCDRIKSIAQAHGVFSELTYEARMEGYYAAHLNTQHEFTIPDVNWDTRKIGVTVEIQITTQLQEVIKRLLHQYYESRRVGHSARGPWQWDYRSDEFVANYLGHILHYVEGMIMEIRSRQSEIPETTPKGGRIDGARSS